MRKLIPYIICALAAVLAVEIVDVLGVYDVIPTGLKLGFIGNVIRAISSNKQRKRLQKEKDRAGTLQDRQNEIKKYKPKFNVDRSGYDDYTDALQEQLNASKGEVSRAGYNLMTAGGRPAGDELARDENRRATANTVSRAINTLGSGSQAMSVLAIADAQERSRNRGIDAQSMQQIANNKRFAESSRQSAVAGRDAASARYSSGLFQKAGVNTDLDVLEYQENELNPFLQAMSDERSLDAAINKARGMTGESFAQVGDDLFSMYMNKKNDAYKLASGLAG